MSLYACRDASWAAKSVAVVFLFLFFLRLNCLKMKQTKKNPSQGRAQDVCLLV